MLPWSWKPCAKTTPPGTHVESPSDFGSQDLEDIISNEEEALARLRIRSVPLQGEDCSLIEEGERVLATHKSHFKTLSFDAMVEKALRVRHSTRISCRCTFVIKWLHQDLKGATSIVPSSSIMKLATQSITVHPMVAAFLKPIKTLNCSAAPSFSTVFEDVDCEVDLHKLLEKQIEEISNLADASKKEISEDILFGIKADIKEQMDCSPVAESKITSSHFQVPHEQENHFKRSTRSSSKLRVNMEVKDPLPPDSSIQKELSENRAYLSPLASRAALASIMSNLPQKLEFSIYHEEENGFACAPDNITNKHVTMDLLNGTKPVKDKLSSEIEAAFIPAEIFKSLITTEKGASRRPLLVEASSEIANPKSQNDASPSLSGLIEERELRQPAKESRFTSSAIQKHAVSSTSNAEMKTHAEEIKSVALTNKRLTRSAVHKQEENLAMEVKQRSEVNNSAQDIESNSSEGNVTIPDRKAPKKKKPVSLPPAAQSSPVTEERNKKRKMPSAVETASKTEGKVSRNGGNSESQKSKSTSSKKQELRFSPRLRFLPRTRSANKC
ncbi:uncharacterized protein LOC100261386 isoform X2 [Vitis vinifera]|uniref:uncharacterized protein LOC100261386 isoform X2 n=1 Tax=Vitis vinifera TaxID=29760 RepID=UPI00053FC9C3|nr:uncharacterized protein LOC100261386 isoform X2 [Vitis vinifera]|eukprot:XP_010654302.1 PREDICTED: uncharacterized protein LOC100261386 isoform X1 [Vitis vinifera]